MAIESHWCARNLALGATQAGHCECVEHRVLVEMIRTLGRDNSLTSGKVALGSSVCYPADGRHRADPAAALNGPSDIDSEAVVTARSS